ncbi:MAG: hypothetical protein ACREBW_03015, partial [Candidatus Micrarchaeaceae archaeon]
MDAFGAAIRDSRPDLIVPCDDVAVHHLHRLYEREERREPHGRICTLIELSLGSPKNFPFLYRRAAFLEAAKQENIRVPAVEVIPGTSDLEKYSGRAEFPFVLKADSTSGGEGVRIVHTHDEALRAFKSVSGRPLVAR